MKKLIAATLFLHLLGCNFSDIEVDKVKGPTLTNTFAFNLGSINYTVRELVEDIEDESLEINEGNDTFLTFIYRDTTNYSDLDDLIAIGDITNSESFSPFAVDIPALPSQQIVNVPLREFDFEFEPDGGEQVDSIFFKGGLLEYTLTTGFNFQVDYTFTLSDVQDSNGDPVTFVRTIPSGQGSDFQSISLAGLKNISNRIGNLNIFNVTLEMTLTVPAGTVVQASEVIDIELVFRNPEFSAVFGDFGMDPIEIQRDSIEITAFDEFNEGGLALNTPSITMEMDNKFGVEMGISLDEIKSVDGTNEIVLTGSVVDNLQFIDAPDHTQLGSVVTTSFSINTSNSNIDDLLNSTPNKIVFDVSAQPNPPGSDNVNNFLFDSSFVEIRTIMEIPLDFRMDGFSKEFDIEISGSDIEEADSLTLVVETVNEIPFSGVIDLSFRDADDVELYLLSNITVIESPTLDGDGVSVGSNTNTANISLDQQGIDAFLNTENIVATINIFTFESSQGNFVKIFADYELDIFLSATGRIQVEL